MSNLFFFVYSLTAYASSRKLYLSFALVNSLNDCTDSHDVDLIISDGGRRTPVHYFNLAKRLWGNMHGDITSVVSKPHDGAILCGTTFSAFIEGIGTRTYTTHKDTSVSEVAHALRNVGNVLAIIL